MALTPGTRLGPYEIVSALGAGGMGEVYKARDTRLDRTVAIKVLPEHVASNPELKQRFEREAKTISSLNHPHICTLYDVGREGDTNFLVMEHLEGETLAQRLTKGSLPLEQALQIAIQIADALDKAHRKGITHRDLKPGNIMLTKAGAKLLDFGLAKLRPGGAAGAVGLSNAPTISSLLTGAGSILGTFQYMAPEQLEGQEVDARTDIFAFGAVVYEMVTGKKAFEGKSQASLIAAIMHSEPPPISAIGEIVPSSLDRVVRTCLAKDPDERFQSAHDLKRAIEWSIAGPEAAPVPSSSKSSRQYVAWAAAAVFAVLAVVGWLRPPPENTVARDLVLTIAPPAASGIVSSASGLALPVISPDGSTVIYRNQVGGYQVRRLDSQASETLPIPDASGGNTFWAPDSRSVVFDGAGFLWRLRLPGGAPERLTAVQGPVLGGTQSDSGVLLFEALKTRYDLFIAPAGGGEAQQIALPGLPEGSYYLPEFLPGTDDFLVTFEPLGADADADEGEIYLATLRDGQPTDPVLLMRNRTAPRYTPAGGGQLLFVRDDVLYAQALNMSARTLEGDPEVVERNVASAPGFRLAHFSVSRAGDIAWRPGGEGLAQLTTFDRAGTEIETSGPPSAILSVKLAPDERRLLVAGRGEQWLAEAGQPGQLVVSRRRGSLTTLWSPDSTRFLVPEPGRVMERPVSGGVEREIASVPGLVRLEDVSPDGNVVLFTGGALATSVFAARLDGGGDPWPVLQTGERVFDTRFAPDGRWIVFEAYPDNVVTGGGIYVQPFPGPGLRRQISPSGQFPVWRKDGAEIVFLDENQVWSIRVEEAGTDLRFSEPEPLFPVRPHGGVEDVTLLAITRDGSRIYLPQPIEQIDSDVIHIRTGWARP